MKKPMMKYEVRTSQASLLFIKDHQSKITTCRCRITKDANALSLVLVARWIFVLMFKVDLIDYFNNIVTMSCPTLIIAYIGCKQTELL